ncbi:alpha/beta hydrolase [Novosphingobium sp.]|uniref:alpha/beta hydrolase n=1 Tax=Novosphingobium sp. TaxID=1874826 RepID=UPI0038BC3F9D
MVVPNTRSTIAGMGTELGPDVLSQCQALFDAEQTALAERVPVAARDCAYGPDARHRLDIYGAAGSDDSLRPILLFVHGGGFRMGDKGGTDNWQNAAVGRLAAEAGLLGAVMNYRLVPDAVWPAGGEDVNAAIDWLVANASKHRGDPDRIVVMGTSAGAVHVSTALQLRADLPVRGLVLLSGLYGYTTLDARDLAYFGDASSCAERMPRDAVASTALPLLVATAEFDPLRFQQEFAGLLDERLARHGALPRAYIASGHNHYSMAMHLGTSDRRLGDEVIGFVRECCT